MSHTISSWDPFVCHVFFSWCLGKAAHHNCGIFWIYSLSFRYVNNNTFGDLYAKYMDTRLLINTEGH